MTPRVRWAIFLLGAWAAGSVAVTVVATQNFYTIDRLLADSPSQSFRELTGQLEASHARTFLRYLSSELNRLYFRRWNEAQLVLGVATFWILTGNPAAARARWGVLAMLVVVVAMTVWLAPAITTLGRTIDFVPRNPPPPELARFGVLHAAYSSLEIAKLLAGLGLAFILSRADR